MMFGTKRFLMIAATGILFMGCSNSKASQSQVKADEVEARAAFSAAYYEGQSQRAAEVLGIVTPSSSSATSGKCAKCHSEFRTQDGLSTLSNQTYYAYQCFKFDLNSSSGKFSTLKCLAGLNGKLTQNELDAVQSGNANAVEEAIRGIGPSDLGFFSAGIGLDSFKKAFDYNANFQSLYTESWNSNSSMPKNGAPLSRTDFESVLGWLLNGMPDQEKILVHDGPQVCKSESETFIGSAVTAHVKRMSLEGEGWNFKNQSLGLKMFGCEGSSCFASKISNRDVFPLVSNWLSVPGQVRQLYTLDVESSYWTRSSADGRYVSFGAQPNSVIVDLMPKLSGQSARKILVEANYDPTFTPDNLSFMFQGDAHGSRLCNQSMLANTNLRRIDFENENCSSTDLNIGLYQSIGSSLDTGDIMAITGSFKSDEGYYFSQDTAPFFSESTTLDLSRVRLSESSVFEKVSNITVPSPYIANWVLSASQKLAVGTVSASTASKKARHGGYRMVLTDSDAIQKQKTLPGWSDSQSALLCVGSGEKPSLSFDERYLVYYAYETHAEKVEKAQSSSNLFVIDLLGNGKPVQLTKMPKGVFAQFPHFRSDGWLYFSVYNSVTGSRQVVASDAVLNLQAN